MNVLENLEREAVNFEGWGLPRASVDTADLALLLAAVRAAATYIDGDVLRDYRAKQALRDALEPLLKEGEE